MPGREGFSAGTNGRLPWLAFQGSEMSCVLTPHDEAFRDSMATPISHVGKPRRREGKGFLHEPPVMQGRAKERSDGAAWGR